MAHKWGPFKKLNRGGCGGANASFDGEANGAGCDLVVYPELCLTTFFHVGISKNKLR